MKKLNRFKREKCRGYLVLGVLLLILGLFIRKVEHIACKVKLVNEGVTLYKNEKWLEAEENFSKAARYSWFEYKEDKVNTYRQDLMWITNFYGLLKDIEEGINQVGNQEGFDEFRDLVSQYDHCGFKSLEEWQQVYLLERIPVEEIIELNWVKYKTMITQLLANASDEEAYDWAKQAVQRVPEQYFSSDKGAVVLNLMMDNDLKYFEKMSQVVASSSQFEKFLNRMDEIYSINSECGYVSSWLIEPVQKYMMATLRNKAQEEMTVFIAYVKACKQVRIKGFLPEELDVFLAKYVAEKEKMAEELVKNKEYEAAIKLYTDMKYFKDYDSTIKRISKAQQYEDDKGFLTQQVEAYSLIQTGSGSFGATKYIMGVTKASRELELVSIEGDEEDFVVTTYRANLNQREVTDIKVMGNNILVTGMGQVRGQHYKVVAFQENKLVVLLDLEADELVYENDGMQIKVINPEGQDEGKTYIYNYTGSGYEESVEEVVEEIEVPQDEASESEDISTSEVEMNLSDIDFNGLQGKTVVFESYVLEEQTDNLTVAVSTSEGGNGQSVYVYYEDGSSVSTGIHTIKGVYTHDTSYSDAYGNEVWIPCIRIIEMK